MLLLFSAISEDTILIFFPKYYVNSCLCVRNSLSNIVIKAKYVGTTEGMMVATALGFSEAGAWR